jgi:aquaporin Z
VPGYGAPDQYQAEWNQENPAVQAQAQAAQQAQAWGSEPIVQDGWQWDPHSQQWFPVGQQPPSAGGQPPAQ